MRTACAGRASANAASSARALAPVGGTPGCRGRARAAASWSCCEERRPGRPQGVAPVVAAQAARRPSGRPLRPPCVPDGRRTCFELVRELSEEAAYRIGRVFDLGAPEVQEVASLALVKLERLAAKRALADAAEALDHMDGLALVEVAAQAMQLLAPADEASAQKPRALALAARPLAGASASACFRELAGDCRAERVVRPPLIEHQLGPGERIACSSIGSLGVPRACAMKQLERPHHLPGRRGAHRACGGPGRSRRRTPARPRSRACHRPARNRRPPGSPLRGAARSRSPAAPRSGPARCTEKGRGVPAVAAGEIEERGKRLDARLRIAVRSWSTVTRSIPP